MSVLGQRLVFAALLICLMGCSEADPDPVSGETPAATAAALPPLLDRNLFFDDPKIAGAAISPDGKWISFIKPYRDVMNIWVKPFEAAFEDARPLTADSRPVTSYFWTQDSRNIVYVQDKAGNENYRLYRIDPGAEAAPDTGVPAAVDLTPYENVRVFIYSRPKRNPREFIVGLNDRNPALQDVYRLNIDSGARELLIRNDFNIAGWITDLDGTPRLAARLNEEAGTDIIAIDNGSLGEVIFSCSFEETCSPTRFHKDGKRVYMVSNAGDADLTGLYLLDLASGESSLIHEDPEAEVDLGGTLFGDAAEELQGVYYIGKAGVRTYALTDQFQERYDFLVERLPEGVLSVAITTEDETRGIISVSSDVNPGATYYYDFPAGTVEKLYSLRPELPTEHLANMQAITYPARDGVDIPAYLMVPKGVEAKNLPTVVLPHGGPWGRDSWGYRGLPQYLANRGYAVLQPNFRGSAGFGKSFLNAGNLQWGTGVMQHDISDGVQYLIDAGIADPQRIGIMGGSYGGYATLAGVAFTPELYAAGVSIVGPSNIFTLLNSVPPYWGPRIRMFHKRVGDPNDPEQRERIMAQSPVFHAENIRAPLLVIQGANDPRVKKAESDQIVVAMRELERPVEYLVAEDEGHGFRGKVSNLAMMVAIERFLQSHLGGRSQDSVEPEIAARLDRLTVDVTTVALPDSRGTGTGT